LTISEVKNLQENKRSLIKRILSRPEFSAVIAAVVIYIFFWSVAAPFRTLAATMTILYQGSTIGLMAVSVALLMIGGEFDLSAGVAVVTLRCC
jgi:simple sugar transport system permease protein